MRRLVCLVVGLALAVSVAGVADARLVHEGTLTGSEQLLGPFTSVASSGNTVVAGYSSVIEEYTEPATGWANATPTATLEGPAGQTLSKVAISGGTVVASYESDDAPWFDAVFVEPPGGWSGTVTPAATLVAPNGWDLTTPVISGDTIVAGATDPHGSAAGGNFVYTRPAGGWSGTLLPSASLRDSSGFLLDGSVAILGATIFIGGERVVGPDDLVTAERGDAFTEPAGGWSGTIEQSATLVGPTGGDPTSASGAVVASYQALFFKPRDGWRGEIRASAELRPGATILSGHLAATFSLPLGPQHECPCMGEVSLYTAPRSGWRGAIEAAPALGVTSETGWLEIALQNSTLFVANDYAIQIYDVQGSYGTRARGPQLSRATASLHGRSGVDLGFSVHVNTMSAKIESLTFRLPKGLRFTRGAQALNRITVGGAVAKKTIRGSQLTVAPQHPEWSVTVTMRRGALLESSALTRSLGASHQNKLVLHGTIVATDAVGVAWTLPVRFRLR